MSKNILTFALGILKLRKMKIVKKLRQSYYNFRAANLLAGISFEEISNIIDSDPNALNGADFLVLGTENQYKIGATADKLLCLKKDDCYDIYYNSIHISICKACEKLAQVEILGDVPMWDVMYDSEGKLISNGDTKTYIVYTFCHVLMPTGRMLSDERYTQGSWGEYVYKMMLKCLHEIYSKKESNKFNNFYDKKYK